MENSKVSLRDISKMPVALGNLSQMEFDLDVAYDIVNMVSSIGKRYEQFLQQTAGRSDEEVEKLLNHKVSIEHPVISIEYLCEQTLTIKPITISFMRFVFDEGDRDAQIYSGIEMVTSEVTYGKIADISKPMQHLVTFDVDANAAVLLADYIDEYDVVVKKMNAELNALRADYQSDIDKNVDVPTASKKYNESKRKLMETKVEIRHPIIDLKEHLSPDQKIKPAVISNLKFLFGLEDKSVTRLNKKSTKKTPVKKRAPKKKPVAKKKMVVKKRS